MYVVDRLSCVPFNPRYSGGRDFSNLRKGGVQSILGAKCDRAVNCELNDMRIEGLCMKLSSAGVADRDIDVDSCTIPDR